MGFENNVQRALRYMLLARALKIPMAREGVTIVDRPSLVTGNAAVVPLVNPARPGTGLGSAVSRDQVMRALAAIDNPTLRRRFLDNVRRMGLRVMQEGGVTDSDMDLGADIGFEEPPPAAVAGESGPEVVMETVEGPLGARLERSGDMNGIPVYRDPSDGRQYWYDADRGQWNTVPMGYTEPGGSGGGGGSSVTTPAQSDRVGWQIVRGQDGWYWVPRPETIPPGLGHLAKPTGTPIQFGPGESIEDYWGYVKPEELFPGVSKEWANFLWRQGPARAAEFFGNVNNPYLTGQKSMPYTPLYWNPETHPRVVEPRGSSGIGTSSTATASASTRGGSSAGAGGGRSVPVSGKEPGLPEGFIMVGGVPIPVEVAAGVRQDYEGGFHPYADADERRREAIGRGELTPTRVDLSKLQNVPTPEPGRPFISPTTGGVYMWQRDPNGTWTLYRQGNPDNNESGWVRLNSTKDFNEVRQLHAMSLVGYNPAIVPNPAFYTPQHEIIDEKGRFSVPAFRARYETDAAFREAVNTALNRYQSPEAVQERVRERAARDPAFARQLYSELVESGQVPPPTDQELILDWASRGLIANPNAFVTSRGGEIVIRPGVNFVQTGVTENGPTGVFILEDGRRYEYRPDKAYVVFIGKDGPAVPWDQVPNREPPKGDQGGYRSANVKSESRTSSTSSSTRTDTSKIPEPVKLIGPYGVNLTVISPSAQVVLDDGRVVNGAIGMDPNTGRLMAFVGDRYVHVTYQGGRWVAR